MIDAPITLTNSLYAAALSTALGLMYFGLAVDLPSGPLPFNTKPSQRLRYLMVVFALAICFLPQLAIILTNNWDQYINGINQWWSLDIIGKLFAGLAYVALFSPIIACITAFIIYRTPYYVTKTSFGHWVAVRLSRNQMKYL